MSSTSPGSSVRHSLRTSPRKGQSPFHATFPRWTSRLGTPLISATSDGSESPIRAMDIDHNRFVMDKGKQAEEARTFALSDTLLVRLAATHPIEMQQAFQAADPAKEMFVGSVHVINSTIGYNVVTSVQTCFVWKIDLNAPFHPPTCYMFPVPPPHPSSPYLTVPFASLLSFGPSREPGLVIISSSGEVRFWDSIGTGLAGAERFSTTWLALADNEFVEGIEHIDAAVYIAYTRTRLHRLTIIARPGTGRFAVVASPFVDPQESQSSSWLNPLRILQRRAGGWEGEIVTVVSPSVRGKSNGKSKEFIPGGGETRHIWVLTSRHLMKWSVNLESGEQCELNYDIKETIAQAILSGSEVDRMSLDVELLDVAVDASSNPTLLVSHRPLNSRAVSPSQSAVAPVRVYGLVPLQLSTASDGYKVGGDIEVLSYELSAVPRRAWPPRLGLLEYFTHHGMNETLRLTFSQFPDAFALASCSPPYQEQLYLNSNSDMILAFNILQTANEQEILLLTTGMVLAVRPNFANIMKMKENVHIGRANVLASTIRQAMKYGIKPENPLRFQLPSQADEESLKTAAEQMSHAFLTSDPEVVPETLSMAAHMSNRQSALQALVTFIGESGGLNKLSQTTRERLLADAEKLAAARGLWDCHNKQAQSVVSHSLLPTVIGVYMSRISPSGASEADAVRIFFNSQVENVGSLVPEIAHIVESSSETSQTKYHLLVQANGLVQALFTRAFQYRSENRPQYNIKSHLVEPWTSEVKLLASLRQCFDMTARLLTQSIENLPGHAEVFGSIGMQDDIVLQLRELASCLFKVYQDRLDFLDSHSQGGASERESNRLKEEFRIMRPEVLGQLVRVNSTDHAFRLAETYRDFRALSELSYNPSAIRAVPAAQRVRDYIQRFGEEFTSELYKWYIEQGKLKLMFDQETEFVDKIDSFFAKNPTPRISWIHDIAKQEYHAAASALFRESEKETNRETRHLMLSIGKLASMAEGPAATPQDKVQAFNNFLDFVAIHDSLLERINGEFGTPADFTVESRAQTVTSSKCAIPTDRPALVDLFRRILKLLLHGNMLTEEDAVDLLSMKDNTGQSSDFVDALIILRNSPYLSESRKSLSLRNVWRRIYLHDNWEQIRNIADQNDYELTAKLRGTQLYKTLAWPALPRDCVLAPSEAAQVPTAENIELRWPGMAPNQVYDLCQDFVRESSALTNSGPSDDEFLHVRKIVEEDFRRNL